MMVYLTNADNGAAGLWFTGYDPKSISSLLNHHNATYCRIQFDSFIAQMRYYRLAKRVVKNLAETRNTRHNHTQIGFKL